jgi:hypothetical protein
MPAIRPSRPGDVPAGARAGGRRGGRPRAACCRTEEPAGRRRWGYCYETCPEPGLPGRVTFPPAPGPAGGRAGGPAPQVAEQKNQQAPGPGGRGTIMKPGSRTQLEAVPGGQDAACGKAGPVGGRGERRKLRPWAPPPLVSAMKKRAYPVVGKLNSYNW